MTKFRTDNTEGFTAAELAEMNQALDILVAEGRVNECGNISDFINNEYLPGKTADDYVTVYKSRY